MVTLCVLAGALALANAPAFAVVQHAYLSQLVESPTTQHTYEGEEAVCGVAVDPATGDVYVAEPGNDAVDIFSAAGKYESQISGLSIPGGAFSPNQTCSVAVSDVTHDVYVADSDATVVYVFNALGGYLETIGGAPGEPFGQGVPLRVAVDNSSGASRGDVYISSRAGIGKVVYRFNSANVYQSQLAVGDDISGIAVGPTGDVYISEYKDGFFQPDPSGVYEFSSAGVELAHMTETPSGPIEAPTGVAVDSKGNVYVGDIHADVVDEFDSAGVFVTAVSGTSPDDSFRLPQGPLGVAVNASGDLYVAEQPRIGELREGYPGVVDEFGPNIDVPYVATGTASSVEDTTASVAGAANPEGVAVTSCEFEYVTDTAYQAAIAARKPNPYEAGSTAACAPSPVGSVASTELDVSAALSGLAESTVYDYRLVAANAQGANYYGGDGTFRTKGPPTVVGQSTLDVTQTGATVKAEVNPDGYETSVYVEYGPQAPGYGSRTAAVTVGATLTTESATIALEGLTTATTYHYRVVAENQASREADKPVDGPDQTLETLPPVRIDHESVSGVGSSSATLNAEIDDFGTASSYYIEYGTSVSYGSVTPVTSLVAADEAVEVGVEVSGLKPATTYHFRIVAKNASGSQSGEDVAFDTFPSISAELPDGRVYELAGGSASGGPGHDANVYVPGSSGMLAQGLDRGQGTEEHGISSERPAEVAADGEAVTYVGDSPASGGNGSEGPSEGNQYLATRLAGGGWTQTTLTPPGFANEYNAFSRELSVGVLETSEELAEVALAGYAELYSLVTAGGPFQPLFTATPENSSPGGFGYVNADDQFTTSLGFAGGNAGTSAVPAFSRLLFEANAAIPSTPAVPGAGAGVNNLYESVGGRLYLINVLPNGKVEPNATVGVQEGRLVSGTEGRDASNAISADGSRIYWSAVKAVQTGSSESELRAQALYLRENATQPQSEIEDGECTEPAMACTVRVDQAEAGLGAGGGGQFVAASGDGSRVFFTDEKRLTSDSSARTGESDLYEYDVEGPEEERLSDLSVPARAGSHADVQGVVGTSQDGSFVYFVADGVLSEGENAEGKEPVEEQPNLYLRHGGVTTFIATLDPEDGDYVPGGGGGTRVGDWKGDPGHRTAEVSPGGSGVVFMSRLPLTGYDNVLDGVHLTEVFVYDTDTGRVVCASCNPSGEAPVAPADPEYATNIKGIWGSFLPVSDQRLANYQPRVISEGGGRVFFDSIEPLVSRDSNGYLDVYEWEAQGEGTCTAQASSRANGGCVFLLSNGKSPENSYLLDASSSGDDVFFVSRAQLVPADRGGDTEVLYDARVGGVPEPAEKSCAGTSCQGVPPAPPIFATPASATITGVEADEPPPPPPAVVKPKPTKCKNNFTKNKKGKCVKRKSKKKSKAKKSSKSKRGGKS